ncbi:ribosome biogenesis GTPase Der [Enterobacteriaceae endosymbiont of Donacia bicoloricornis]|uniref:ribosome biogenesis GTPase Der n=1 Tax=Enterobacteriaceae endosymbiont of Donacia bicoloricornis TaxID=2675772 RepID=UPI001448ABCF|nr:ribosome biogenesis GTPase Der [Enterobacteriaceae endosymbiont of Donacia bicoloricornis]QJC37581.1 ribosome biogenesis GTPase Der [Enterobacteriaceae endosymbiont of Donacia bicoloricornis]
MKYKYPIITILGDSNVGKSSLYNILIKKYDSLVNKIPNFTIDRKYENAQIKNYKFICVDTISYNKFEQKKSLIKEQILLSIKESNIILLMIKGDKLNITDYKIINYIRKYNKKIIIIVNIKKKYFLDNEFYSLGIDFYQIDIMNKNDILKFKKILFFHINKIYIKKNFLNKSNTKFLVKNKNNNIKLAIVGMQNVGKSTLINKFVNEKRTIIDNMPGTTRENISISLNHLNKNITVIDTAGIKKKNKITNQIEKISIIESYKTIKVSNIILYIIDGEKKIFCNQDIKIIKYIISQKKPIIILINKIDLIKDKDIFFIKNLIKKKFKYFPIISISAKFILNLEQIFKLIYKIYNISKKIYSTSKLMKILNLATKVVLPPIYNGRRIKLKYIHQLKSNFLIFKIHGNQLLKLNNNYKNYLINFFYKKLQCIGSIINFKFQENKNPYK